MSIAVDLDDPDFLARPMGDLRECARPRPFHTLSEPEVDRLEDDLDDRVQEVYGWITQPPQERDVTLIGRLIRLVEDAIAIWQQNVDYMSTPRFQDYLNVLKETLSYLSTQQRLVPRNAQLVPAPGPAPGPPPSRLRLGLPGAPRLHLNDDLIRCLLQARFHYKHIATLVHASERTIRRRAKEWGLAHRMFTPLTVGQLAEAVQDAYMRGSGRQGYRAVQVYLRQGHLFVPRPLVQVMCSILNPTDLDQRRLRVQMRREYVVPWINFLWHVDGHHKLNPWKIVIHGGIDGRSHRVVYLTAANNNRADTVEQLFLEACGNFGWPSRVRADYGGENIRVKRQMEEHRGLVDSRGRPRHSFIQGPSTRNQRIERLWVDVQNTSTSRYRVLFIKLQAQGHLNPNAPLDVWALHFVYIPTINRALQDFADYWDTHGMSSEGGLSPQQLWLLDLIEAEPLGISLIQNQACDPAPDHPLNQATTDAFMDYCLDDNGRQREPQSDDPHVEVHGPNEDLLPHVRQALRHPPFMQALRDAVGDVWPLPPDENVAKYLRAREMVYEQVGEVAPRWPACIL